MYAIIETGGKQYKVAKDDILEVEKLDGKKVTPSFLTRSCWLLKVTP